MKPSDIVIAAPCPLVGTMGRAEREFAAALIVRACQALGDSWQPVTWEQVASALKADVAANREPIATLVRNPFFRPDVHDLVAHGFATMDGDTTAMTDAGLTAIAKWARRGGAES